MQGFETYKSRRGVALVLVIFAIAFGSVLAVGMLAESATDLQILRNHTSGLRALYAADAGVSGALAALRTNYLAFGTVVGTVSLPDGTSAAYSAAISNANPIVTITSTGTLDGFTRKVQVKAVVAGSPTVPLPPYPVRVISWQEVVGP